MIKWDREVKASQTLDPMEAFEVNKAVLLIKSALESGIKAFIGSDDGLRILYANGLNGTLFDCDVNCQLPRFEVFAPDETMARIVCTVSHPRNGETLLVTLQYREAGSEKWKKAENSIALCESDWDNLKKAFDAAFDNEYDYDVYWGVGE